jgi:hypothetical protein
MGDAASDDMTDVFCSGAQVWSDAAGGCVDSGGSSSGDINITGNPGDNADQLQSGGSISSSDWKNMGGVCKAVDFPALNAAKNLQSQMNRVAFVKGFNKITVDGDIGPATITLLKQVQSASGQTVGGDTSSCVGVASSCDVIANQVTMFANNIGAPATVPQATSSGSINTKSGLTLKPPGASAAGDILGAFGGLSTIQQVAVVAVGGFVIYQLMGRSAASKRRSTTKGSRR